METSVLRDEQNMFGVRSLLNVEKVLMNNDLTMQPAINRPRHFFIT